MYQCINVHTAQLKLVKPQGSNNIFWQYLMGKGAAATLIFLLIFPPEEEIDWVIIQFIFWTVSGSYSLALRLVCHLQHGKDPDVVELNVIYQSAVRAHTHLRRLFVRYVMFFSSSPCVCTTYVLYYIYIVYLCLIWRGNSGSWNSVMYMLIFLFIYVPDVADRKSVV